MGNTTATTLSMVFVFEKLIPSLGQLRKLAYMPANINHAWTMETPCKLVGISWNISAEPSSGKVAPWAV